MKIYLKDLEIEEREISIEIYPDSDTVSIISRYDDEVQMVCEVSLKELEKAIKFLK